MQLNVRLIFRFIGTLITLNGGFMLFCLPFGFYYSEPIYHILISAIISLSFGSFLWLIVGKTSNRELNKKDGYAIVTFGWLAMVLTGTLPYLFSGSIPDFTNAFFETMSGYTTTGSTILEHIESYPKNILFWRSLTQWIGGMGIIVLVVAILPILGVGGMRLFIAESPGIVQDKLNPHIRGTASRLWLIYVGLTALELIFLLLGGMNFYDAINHAFATTSSGGFSVKQDSIAFYSSPFIQYVIIFFMILAGSNFTLMYFCAKAQFKKLFGNEEFRYYILIIVGATVIGFLALTSSLSQNNEAVFREILFQVVSTITTTGFSTADYTSWSSFLTSLFFILMFIGASTGSTSGGIKIIRHIVLFKNGILSMKRLFHPNAIIPVRVNGKAVHVDMITQVYGFIMLYIIVFLLGVVIISGFGIDFETSIGAVAATLGNIGPGIGSVGPSFSFASLPLPAKWFLSFLMLLGRLEFLTILILFSTYYWSKQ